MPDIIDLVNDALVTATGVVEMRTSNGSAIKKVPTNGNTAWALTTKNGNADTATVKLKGTNNPDPADTNGKDLITNSHTVADQQDGSAADVPWKYVFVQVTAEGAGAGVSLAAAAGVRLRGQAPRG